VGTVGACLDRTPRPCQRGQSVKAWWLIAGVLLSGPVWIALTVWVARRTWRAARRLAARTKGHEHAAELAQLAGGLAHEIKNPLSTININLKLLAEDLDRHDDELHGRWLRRLRGVQEETDRLRVILDDFLHFAGKYELALAQVDLRHLVDELVDFFAPQTDAAHIIMRTSLPEAPVTCRVDANLIKQALLNLMINAVQAMDKGGELLIRVGTDSDRALIEVIDTGPGIETDKLQAIFQAYYSTKKDGTGLGLSTTQRIIREHDGTLQVNSETGKGTRFVIALPLVRD